MRQNSISSTWSAKLKIGLIPMLAVTLVAVLIKPFLSGHPTGESAAGTQTKAPEHLYESAAAADRQSTEAWARIEPGLANRFNPFTPLTGSESAVPDTLSPGGVTSESTVAPSSPEVDKGQSTAVYLKVDAVHEAEGVFSALIDGKLVRVGDSLPGDRRCIAITPVGVLVESASVQESNRSTRE